MKASETEARDSKTLARTDVHVASGAQVGVIGDHAHVEGGIHFHAPPPPIPLQRPLPAQHFTGRDDELAQLIADLQPGQTVTLVGPGGVGKTALAAQAIWTLCPEDDPPTDFPDGIILHNFYDDPEAVHALEAIARAYGQEPTPTPAAAAQPLDELSTEMGVEL